LCPKLIPELLPKALVWSLGAQAIPELLPKVLVWTLGAQAIPEQTSQSAGLEPGAQAMPELLPKVLHFLAEELQVVVIFLPKLVVWGNDGIDFA